MWNLYWYYGIICKNTTDLIQIIGKLPGNGYENGIEDKSMDVNISGWKHFALSSFIV